MQPTSTTVQTLCRSIHIGETVVPDFQRDFVWKPDDIQDLLVSVLGDYYIGTMLTMNSVASDSPFALRLIEGVSASQPAMQTLVKIILDGQQRSSSLYYALYAPNIPLPGRRTAFKYFLNIQKTIEKEWDLAVEYHPVRKGGVTIADNRSDLVAFTAFDNVGKILKQLQDNGFTDKALDVVNAVNGFLKYSIQVAELSRETALDRVVETFERINRTGLPLRTIDLLVARLYQKNIKLRELISTAEGNYNFLKADDDFEREFILRTMCIMRGKDVRKKEILNLEPQNFQLDWEEACKSLDKA